jgi:hypothetical protein
MSNNNKHKENKMLKHIGRHGDRKVAIVFREIPGEDHMCLVVYPDVLPTHIHNSVMSVLESAPGQAATTLADVFHRNLLPDGRAILEALHREGMLKKIATNQVIVTPTATASVKLDELNRLVREMESGTEALKRMQEIDKSAGMVAPEVKRMAEAEFKNKNQVQPLRAPENGALDDKAIAGNMLQQAKQMELDAKSMIAEAARMKKDAERMFPGANTGDAKKAEATPSAPKARTRKKAVTADAIQ